ncbi:MAG: HDOD domain-containing protein [Phycisphaerae bacterium]|nr:HDOD domain-containing protein [Phycisphaerae bacterium]
MNQELQIQRAKSRKIELVLHQLNSLPTLPTVATRLLQLTVRSDTQAHQIVELIESDPSLASKIIALATSASTGVSKSSASLSKAVVLLGFDAVRNAVLSIKVFEALKGHAQESVDGFDWIGFWKHSLGVACASKLLIKHIDPKVDPEEAFVCGLLHDIGKLALASSLPKSYDRVVQLAKSAVCNIAEVEQKVLGVDHTIAGKRLAEKWALPEAVIESIWLHHQWVTGLPEAVKNRSMVQTIHLADIITRREHIGYSGNQSFSDSAENVAMELGCKENVLAKVTTPLRELISERASILGLEDIEPTELYQEALVGANDVLGKLNTKLQVQNQRLKLRSNYFDLLSTLANCIEPNQTAIDLCQQIVELWQQHSKCKKCAVYAIDREEQCIEGMLKTEPDDTAALFMIDMPEGFGQPEEGFNIKPVDKEHYWFFEQVAPMFEMGVTVIMPLTIGSELIGEVLWQSDNENFNYKNQLKELQALACSIALTLKQTQIRTRQSRLCEQMGQSNEMLQKAQQKLMRTQNLATIGEMAAGAAHEINNPLAIIVGRAQLLASTEQDEKRLESLNKIAANGKEITNIITDLMNFADPPKPNPYNIWVGDLIELALERMQDIIQTKNIMISTKLAPDLPDVFVDREQISEALIDLISNAIEAYMDQPGAIEIKAVLDELENQVLIEISDNGCGMDPVTLEKATDPFFSFKPAGRKRGLGLSRSIRKIERNSGKVKITSQLEKGTTVFVSLKIKDEIETA